MARTVGPNLVRGGAAIERFGNSRIRPDPNHIVNFDRVLQVDTPMADPLLADPHNLLAERQGMPRWLDES